MVGLVLEELVVGLVLDGLVVGLVLDGLVVGLLLVVLVVVVEGFKDEDDVLVRLVLETIGVEDDVELERDRVDEEEVVEGRTLLGEEVERLADEDETDDEVLVEDADDVEDVDEIVDELEVIGSGTTVSENTLM